MTRRGCGIYAGVIIPDNTIDSQNGDSGSSSSLESYGILTPKISYTYSLHPIHVDINDIDKQTKFSTTEHPERVSRRQRRVVDVEKPEEGLITADQVVNVGIGGQENRCDICNKCFTLRTNLTAHYQKHMGQTNCPFCSQVYSTVGNLKTHINRVHSSEATTLQRS